jgi:hypothetical protein
MGTETDTTRDFLRINALADGELSAHERAEVAARIADDRDMARAHATIARLKACVAEETEPAASISIPTTARHSLRRPLGLGAIALAAGLTVLLVAIRVSSDHEPVPVGARDAVISLAALPANPVIPDLTVAGLKLTDLGVDRSGRRPFLLATYSGPHGCRLDLRVHPSAEPALPLQGTSRHAWTVDDVAYELAAHGMPGWRFTLIAEAAERETRRGTLPDGIGRRLREARAAAPPCAG